MRSSAPTGLTSPERAELPGSFQQTESKSATPALLHGKGDPKTEEAVDDRLFVYPHVNRAQPNALDNRFDGLSVGLDGRKEHVGRTVIEDRIGHVLAAQRIECSGISD